MDDAIYDFDEEQSPSKPRRPGLPVEPRRVFWILAEYRQLLLRTLIGAAVFAVIASFFLPRSYESSAHILYEGIPLIDEGQESLGVEGFLDSALSPSRLREVRERSGSSHSLRDLEAQLSVILESECSVRIVAKAGTAEEAQALAQTMLDVFAAHTASFNAKRLDTLRAETRLALKRATEQRAEATRAVDAFREKSGKPHLLQDQKRLLERVSTLRSKADEASVDVAAQRARIEELQKAQKELPRHVVSSATVGTPIDGPLATARAELATARATLSEQHPRVQALQQRVNSLQKQQRAQPNERGGQTMTSNPARDAVEQDLASTRAALAAAEEREAALRVLIQSVKAEADALAPVEGEARQIVQELEIADERFQQLKARAARLEDGAIGPMTGFRVLSLPHRPEEARRSSSSVGALAAVPLAAVLILALVLLARRLRTLAVEAPREVAWWGNGPVLGTSVWPRDPDALETFVDELEDHGVYGAGRTLVVPATETERDIACAFAIRLSEAPWLAAAILDVEERPRQVGAGPLVTPSTAPRAPLSTAPPRQLSSQSVSSMPHGPAVKSRSGKPPARPTIQGFVPPISDSKSASKSKWSSAPPPPPRSDPASAPPFESKKKISSRPPRKKTIVGLPAVDGSTSSAPPAPVERKPVPRTVRGVARATVRMVAPRSDIDDANKAPESGDYAHSDEEVILLTRPVKVAGASRPPTSQRPLQGGPEDASPSQAVMRAVARLLGDDDEVTSLRRSNPPTALVGGGVPAVALAWNGPLSGPVLRRAARLAHRVLVVVSSGLNVVELSRVTTRLGREKGGVGYVLVNLDEAYVDLEDRVGDFEAFWAGSQEADTQGSHAS